MMDFSTYQALAMRTSQWQPGDAEYQGDQHRRYAAMSLVGEAGEVVDALKKRLSGRDVPREKILLELGDVAWGIACVCEVQDHDFVQAMTYAECSAVDSGDEFHLALTLCRLASRAGEFVYVGDGDPGENDDFFDATICFVALVRTLGFALDEVLAANIAKLAARYPDGAYSHEASIARADEGPITANHRAIATVEKRGVSVVPGPVEGGE